MKNLVDIAEEAVERARVSRKKAQYRDDPVLWCKEIAGIELWDNPNDHERSQQGIAESVAKNHDTAVKAGHGVGKSTLAALLTCWWIDTRYPGNCFVASTAPSTAQIGAIVWREIRMIRARVTKRYEQGVIDHELPGYVTADNEWKVEGGMLVGFGRKPPDEDVDSAFQGIHATEGVLAIGDEAVGLTEEMIDALGNITSTSSCRRLLICNPTNPASHVAKLFKNKPKNWAFHTISVFDSPHFTGAEMSEDARKSLTDHSYVDGKREEYGEGSPRWMSRVLGEFAWDQGYTLFRTEDTAKGFDCEIDKDKFTPVLGVDVSRSKDGDMNTVYINYGGHLRFLDEWNSPDAMVTADKVNELARLYSVSEVRIDGVGLGGPIADAVRRLSGNEYQVLQILGGDASPDKKRWYNFRAWMYWSFHDRMRRGEIDIDVTDEALQDQLLGIEIKKRTAGLDNLLLESKEDMRKRGISSPDHADAAAYAVVDLTAWTGNPLNKFARGSKVVLDTTTVQKQLQAFNPWYEGSNTF